jgi:hypothetical protein
MVASASATRPAVSRLKRQRRRSLACRGGGCTLVLRPQSAGLVPYSLPSVYDVPTYGATLAARNFGRRAARSADVAAAGGAPEPLFVAIYNNGAAVQARAHIACYTTRLWPASLYTACPQPADNGANTAAASQSRRTLAAEFRRSACKHVHVPQHM